MVPTTRAGVRFPTHHLMNPGALVGAAPALERYLSEIARDHAVHPSWAAGRAPDRRLRSRVLRLRGRAGLRIRFLSWDYGLTTWHTNRDTYDKIVFDDLRSNVTLIASVADQAAEDPATMPRDRVDPLPANPQAGHARAWPECRKTLRSAEGYAR
jgi:hypothetical protein